MEKCKRQRGPKVEELVNMAKDGDIEAVNLLIERYKGFILKEAGKYRIPSYDFEDVVQHGYLTVIHCIKKYKMGSSAFSGYVLNAIRNNIGDLLRRNIKHFREVPDDTISGKCRDDGELTLEDQMIAYEQVKKLYKALDQLKQEERDLVENFYIREEALVDIAKRQDICVSTLRYRKRTVLKKLHTMLENEG